MWLKFLISVLFFSCHVAEPLECLFSILNFSCLMAEVPLLCTFLSCHVAEVLLLFTFLFFVMWLKCLFSVLLFSYHVAKWHFSILSFLVMSLCTFVLLLRGWTEVPLLCTILCSRSKCCGGRISSVVGERAVAWSVEVTGSKWCCCCGVAVGDCRKEATAAKEKFSKKFRGKSKY
jgi:hypothetical protein